MKIDGRCHCDYLSFEWRSRNDDDLQLHRLSANERRAIGSDYQPPALTQRPVREARNADGRAAVNAGKEKTAVAGGLSYFSCGSWFRRATPCVVTGGTRSLGRGSQ
jgi:hypothetical protein